MFKIQANPTFPATIKIVGQGREQELKLTFRHKTRDDYLKLLEGIKGESDLHAALLEIVEKWEADMELGVEAFQALQQHQPGADWAIIHAYGDALTVARKGN